jgi:hypothetical protein
MNTSSFRQAFKNSKPKLITNGNGCVAANSSKMNSLGVLKIPMTIRGRKFVHPVTVVEDINDNIIGIDFMHLNKMNYDTHSQQITFSHMLTNALYAVKETTIAALSSMVISSKFKGNICDTATPIAMVNAPQNPTISGMPARVTLDKYKNCKMVIDNCAPYDIVIARNKILGVLQFEPEECIPMTENSISAIISEMHQKFPKAPKKQFTRDEIAQKAKLQVPNEYKKTLY